MSKLSGLIGCGIAVVYSTSAATQEQGISLFGIELGKPVTLPACPVTQPSPRLEELRKQYGKAFEHEPALDFTKVTQMCLFGRDVHWPRYEGPRGVRRVTVRVEGALIEQIDIETVGMPAQSLFMDQLTQKFGEPSSKIVEEVQNGLGAKFSGINAVWNIGSSTVSFFGIVSRLDNGSIRAQTAQGAETQRQIDERNRNQGPRL